MKLINETLGQILALAHLWKTLHFATPACSRRWRTEATRFLSPPSRPTRLLSSRTQCRLWCSHLHRKKKTCQGVTICRTVAGDPRTVVLPLHLTGLSVGKSPQKNIQEKKNLFEVVSRRPDVALKRQTPCWVRPSSRKFQKYSGK